MWIISRVPASPPFVHKPAAAVSSCCMEPCRNSSDLSYSVSCSRSCRSSASSGCRHSLIHQDPVRVTLVPRSPPDCALTNTTVCKNSRQAPLSCIALSRN
ncbi:hypothetical protein XELAEV_18018559mg [Xenopus laevis]|uniref:Uncharacterized protein n=1 Tax=Xenopus laevis TaxID=8355 RepID=A0A974HTQ9_XENLA|nr:hypothetical protein XELAEV_18018559mg [Xenopus laevis]